MPDFLQPRRISPISRLEVLGLVIGVSALVLAWPLAAVAWLSNTSTGVGIAILGLTLGSVFKDWRWRRLFSTTGIDPNVKVYTSRGDYGRLVHNIRFAREADFMGISLAYTLEYMRDNGGDFFDRVGQVRILLPLTREICDGRDMAQGTQVGSLWRQLEDLRPTIGSLLSDFPTHVEVRYFSIQPYMAFTRVDDRIWVSPYITKSGNSSPVLAIEKSKSPGMYATMSGHFQRIWSRSQRAPA